MKSDTIAAIATAMSNAGISIIRISGEEAFAIIEKIYHSPNPKKIISEEKSHTVHYGYIYDGEEEIDEVLVLLMRGPHSYTGEDVVEIDCHGGITVTKKILETVLKYGARPAEPGEFTKRAFLNGKMDLSQAEAVIDIINAKNEYALKSSIRQLRGNILEKIKDIRKNVIRDVAFIEAALDDPEHMSVDGFGETLLDNVNQNLKELEKLLKSADNGRRIKEGIRTVLVGKPNAGKSSLLNVLVGEDRAIVTDVEGTTRDILEESINLDGVTLQIIDTAGIRDTKDQVEKIGVEKAREHAKEADLIIYVADSSRELDENDMEIIDILKEKQSIVLLNKMDLDNILTKEIMEKRLKDNGVCTTIIPISAKEEKGIEQLEETLKDMFYEGKLDFNDEIYITNARHKAALQRSMDSLLQVKKSIEDEMPEDFYSIDLMEAYEALGEIIGESVGEDLVNTIFSEFCMGK